MHEERGSSKRVRYRRTNRGELVTRLVTRRDPRWGEGGVVARSCVPCSTLVSVRTTRQREEGWPEARIEEWREKRLVQAARQAGRQAGKADNSGKPSWQPGRLGRLVERQSSKDTVLEGARKSRN